MLRRIARVFKVRFRSDYCPRCAAMLAENKRLIIDRGHLIDELGTAVEERDAARAENVVLRHRVAMLEVPS